MRIRQFQRFYEGGEAGGAGAGEGEGGAKKPPADQDIEYWKAEAKKAFADRQRTANKLKDLEGRVLSDEDRQLFDELKAAQVKADEEKKRKEGEFDALRQQLVEKHKADIEAVKAERDQVRERFKTTMVKAQFGSVPALFGGETAKTILDPEMAEAVLGRFVKVDETDGRYSVTVTLPNGDTILGDDGKPAAFADAIEELIAALPNKDRILRGSGKTGSGSAGGGSTDRSARDLDHPTADDFQDPKFRADHRRRTAKAGGLVVGKAWDKLAPRP